MELPGGIIPNKCDVCGTWTAHALAHDGTRLHDTCTVCKTTSQSFTSIQDSEKLIQQILEFGKLVASFNPRFSVLLSEGGSLHLSPDDLDPFVSQTRN